ncbi:MAG TPA: hypothetical protein VGH89_14675 [Pseudonocardia sp.]|jgi:hypothetical protein
MARRSNSGVTNFLSDITDDIKDFLDDEVIDRGRDTERDLRRAGRNWTDSADDRDGYRRGQSGRRYRDDELDELRDVVAALTRKVDQVSTGGTRGSSTK